MLAADVPTSADWLAAWGQVGGAVATTIAVVVALWLGFRDRRWRRADQLDQQIAQARLITVGVIHVGDELDPDTTFLVTVTNDSEKLVRDVGLVSLGQDARWPRYVIDVDSQVAEEYATNPDVVRPGGRVRIAAYFVDQQGKPTHLAGRISVTVAYVDATGLRWQRTDSREPVRVLAS